MTFRQLTSALAAAASLIGPFAAHADATGPRRVQRVGEVAIAQPTRVAPTALASRTTAIYNNFEKVVAPFQDGGYLVYGPFNGDGAGKQFVAVPFVSKKDTLLSAIAIAVSHDAGTSVQLNVRVGLYADAGGVPGSLITSWALAPVVDYTVGNYSYPVVATAQDSAVPLGAGITYWVAVDTTADSDFIGQWSFTSGGLQGTGTQGPVAYWNDYTSGWKAMNATLPALAVYGRAP